MVPRPPLTRWQQPIKLVTFDAFHTLYTPRRKIGSTYAEEIRKVGASATDQQVEHAFREVHQRYVKRYPLYGIHKGMSCRTWWEKVILDTFHYAGITGVDQEQFQRVCTTLYEKFATPEPYRVYPESQDTLLALAQRGIKLGIISNSDDRTAHLINELGLGSYMDFILVSALEGIEKPSSAIFQKALRLVGTSPQQALHVGDDYHNDYRGPILVGMHALLIDRNANDPSRSLAKDSPHCISNLTQVLDWI
ncbi:hypothetical protein IWQ61_009807 [Dispira simplex]|nr:hypothetical protein IWQ61_009807 [Dispira simplex]